MSFTITATPLSASTIINSPSIDKISRNAFQELLYCTDLQNIFLNLNEFAIEIDYYHSSMDLWKKYNVLFDDPHASFGVGEGQFNTLRPQIQLKECGLLNRILKNDKVKIKNITYRIEDFVSDGVGVITVYLRLK